MNKDSFAILFGTMAGTLLLLLFFLPGAIQSNSYGGIISAVLIWWGLVLFALINAGRDKQ